LKKVLITGAAGFLGSHLCDRFLAEGFHVVGMDNLITGNMDNIAHLFPEKHFEFYHHDVSKFVHVPGNLDYILHFASPASPIDYLKMPIQTMKVGALGTHNLCGLAKAKGARLLIASTSEVYGDPLVHPQQEDYWGNVNPIGPRGVYDEAKRFQEAITMAYHTFHGLETRIIRIFNTYGPRMRVDDGRVMPAFFSQAIRGEGLTINPHEITIGDFAKEVLAMVNNPEATLTFHDLPQDDPKKRRPDITRAKEVLGWEPKVSRHEGMLKTYEYFKTVVEVNA